MFTSLIAIHVICYYAVFVSHSTTTVYCQWWNYENQEDWPARYPSCGGQQQSPVNIITSKVLANRSLELHFSGYFRKSASYSFVNNGRTVKFDYTGSRRAAPSIADSDLDRGQRFYLNQLHFHWGIGGGGSGGDGSGGSGGSEHQIDGYQFDMELHLVHSAASEGKVDKSSDRVVVLAVLYQINQLNESSLSALMRNLVEVKHRRINETVPITFALRLADLLPDITDGVGFFEYTGSLTTPPCTEDITWYVMNYPKFIGYKQMNEFYTFPGFVNKKSFREIQALNDRVVQMSK